MFDEAIKINGKFNVILKSISAASSGTLEQKNKFCDLNDLKCAAESFNCYWYFFE